jgi:hypothetical protein
MIPRHHGYFQEMGPTPLLLNGECDTSTCKHCSRITYLKPPENAQVLSRGPARCHACMGELCEECYAQLAQGSGCVPFEKKLEAFESKQRLVSAILG